MRKFAGTHWNPGTPDFHIELNDKARWCELKAVKCADNWLPSTPIQVTGDVHPEQWAFLHDNASRNRNPRQVASMVVTGMRTSHHTELMFVVLAGGRAFIHREYGIPWGILRELEPGSGIAWPSEGLAIANYQVRVGQRESPHPMPLWPLLEPWWLEKTGASVVYNDGVARIADGPRKT